MPYLMRRGRFFYFRKRLLRAVSEPGSNLFLCLSLQTDLLLVAVRRASALIAALEERVTRMIRESGTSNFCPEMGKTILQEFLRAEMARLLEFEARISDQTEDSLEARVREREEETRQLHAAARKADWSTVREPLGNAAKAMQIEPAELTVSCLLGTPLGLRSSGRRNENLERRNLSTDTVLRDHRCY
ncbi:hypothetical protein [Antarctobacter jejuensis]|uniref:hypothetical protein n=1 Tax=Antarctobacter jejuensis TaxID=1439938 RepID=UPI003FD4721B